MSSIEGYLGIAARARKVVSGALLLEAVRHKQVNLVLVASDASERTKKQYRDKCATYQIPCLIWADIATISSATGLHMRVAIGIANVKMADNIRKIVEMR